MKLSNRYETIGLLLQQLKYTETVTKLKLVDEHTME